jgi:hypothetical protein
MDFVPDEVLMHIAHHVKDAPSLLNLSRVNKRCRWAAAGSCVSSTQGNPPCPATRIALQAAAGSHESFTRQQSRKQTGSHH